MVVCDGTGKTVPVNIRAYLIDTRNRKLILQRSPRMKESQYIALEQFESLSDQAGERRRLTA